MRIQKVTLPCGVPGEDTDRGTAQPNKNVVHGANLVAARYYRVAVACGSRGRMRRDTTPAKWGGGCDDTTGSGEGHEQSEEGTVEHD